MSKQRGEKHGRAQSAISRDDAKRIRDDETIVSEMSVDHWLPTSSTNETSKKAGKRRQASEEEDSATELGNDDDLSNTIEDDEEWLAKQSAQKKNTGKVARTGNVDSPSHHKRRVKGRKDPFITSPPGTKARGKRILDDSDDHEIGDEWTDLNGLRWRMGDDRELRREAIVVEMRFKYPDMPKDSRHPDAKIKIPVHVEKFLTEQEYDDMKSKKLLGFQELERQREIEEAEAKKREKEEEEARERQRAIAERGDRTIATPKKVRDVYALYDSPFKRPSISPLRGVLPSPMQRSRSTSSVSSTHSSSSKASVPHKRLSLSMGSGNSSKVNPPESPETKKVPMSAPPKRSSNSLRIPLSSPSSQNNSSPSPLKRLLGSLGSVVARTKREESLLKILKEEDERKKKRESSLVK
ncbi:uncharacterized protein FA14DRAFT_40103 [Meira miltonrushii]|uniref:Uncharacterized protein n=1 Tax=Meira miltonrushii TaxID=1280837 RepID=A0A316VCF9_9BASI|nr:uncharacterized protein FA14DRAFT_40103 [Meira miltonrushii]PWN35319.1 hypothetical protein FA14DRAFT_40103 [Meira miltonrushii]